MVVSVGHAGDAGKAVGIDGVHGDGDAAESGILQRLRQIGEQMTVGGEGNIERIAAVDRSACAASRVRGRTRRRPLRSSGSPPVRRIFVIPMPTSTRAMRR